MNRRACLEALLPLVTDQLVVASVSGQWVWGQSCTSGRAGGLPFAGPSKGPHRKRMKI
jgi:hypothetical protein